MANKEKSSSNPSSSDSWLNSSKSIIQERGLDYDPADGEFEKFICDTIKEYKWEQFAKSPGNFVLDFVIEFYKNMDAEKNKSTVQGKSIDFSADKINEIFGLEPVDDSEAQYFFTHPNFNLIEQELCPYGADWGFDKKDNVKNSMKGVNIAKKAKPFLYFISTRFTPNSNPADLRKNRFTLLYALYSKMPLDVGKLINANLKKCVGATCRSIWFPSSITRLCAESGVSSLGRADIFSSDKKIGKKFWAKLEPTDGPKKSVGVEMSSRRVVPPKQTGWRLAVDELKQQMSQIELKMTGGFSNLEKLVKGLKNNQREGFDRSENIQMQGLIYICPMIGLIGNLLNMYCAHSGFHGGPSQFPYFEFHDPSTFPMPRYINVPSQNPPILQEPVAAQPLPVAPTLTPQSSSHDFFAALPDLVPQLADTSPRRGESHSVSGSKKHRIGKEIICDDTELDSAGDLHQGKDMLDDYFSELEKDDENWNGKK